MKKGIVMKIDNAKSIKIASQPQFKGDTVTAKKEEESSNNTGKILLALTGLAALGGGAYLILKKGKGAEDAKDAAKDTIDKAKAESTQRAEKLKKKEIFKEIRRDVVPIVRKFAPYVDSKDTKKLLALGKARRVDPFWEKGKTHKIPQFIVIKGDDPLSREKIAEYMSELTQSVVPKPDLSLNPKEILNSFYAEDIFHGQKDEVKWMHVIHEADTVFEKLKLKAPEEYDKEVDKMAAFIAESQKKQNHGVIFTVKDESALPDKLKALIDPNATLQAKQFKSKNPMIIQRTLSQIGHSELSNQVFDKNSLLQLGRDFDRKSALGETLPSSIMIHAPYTAQSMLKNLPELTQTELKPLPQDYLSHERIIEGIGKFTELMGPKYQESQEKRLLYIGDIADIFGPAKNALSRNDYIDFRIKFKETLASAPKSGVTVVYTVSDAAKLPEEGLTEIAEYSLRGSFARTQNWGKHRPQTFEQIEAGVAKAQDAVKDRDDLYSVGHGFKDFYETSINESDRSFIPNSIPIIGHDAAKIEQVLSVLPEITSSKLVRVNGREGFDQAVKEARQHKSKTGQMTLIYVGDHNKIAYPDGIIPTDNDRYPTDGEDFLNGIVDTVFKEQDKPYRAIISMKPEDKLNSTLNSRLSGAIYINDEPNAI